jgi:hypothetical protein
MPRADLLRAFDTEISEVPSTTNPLGMRAGSEGGITPTAELCGAYHGRLGRSTPGAEPRKCLISNEKLGHL